MTERELHCLIAAIFAKDCPPSEAIDKASSFMECYNRKEDLVLGKMYLKDCNLTSDRVLLGSVVLQNAAEEMENIVFWGENVFMERETYDWIRENEDLSAREKPYEGAFVVDVENVYIHHYYLKFWVRDGETLVSHRKEILVGDTSKVLGFARLRVRTGVYKGDFQIP